MIAVGNELAERGHAVEFVVLKRVGDYESHIDSRARIVALDAWRMLFSLPKLVSYLRRERPEVLLATDEYTHLLALLARPLAGVRTRVVLRIGNMFSELYARYSGLKRALTYALMRFLYRYADAVIANSKGAADDIRALAGVPSSRVAVVLNPKDLDGIRALAEKPVTHPWLESKDIPVALAGGRLREQKNLPFLIRAFVQVARETPARLIIIGKGREEGKLRALIEELHAGDIVSLAGYQDNPYAWMEKCDFFVTASLWEGMPNTLMEAMVTGLPVIASDCPSGPRELLAPESDYRARLAAGIERAPYGILTAVSDEEALVEALRALLVDRALRADYARQSRIRAEDFNARAIVSEYERVLFS